jgi:hypothetical protein
MRSRLTPGNSRRGRAGRQSTCSRLISAAPPKSNPVYLPSLHVPEGKKKVVWTSVQRITGGTAWPKQAPNPSIHGSSCDTLVAFRPPYLRHPCRCRRHRTKALFIASSSNHISGSHIPRYHLDEAPAMIKRRPLHNRISQMGMEWPVLPPPSCSPARDSATGMSPLRPDRSLPQRSLRKSSSTSGGLNRSTRSIPAANDRQFGAVQA